MQRKQKKIEEEIVKQQEPELNPTEVKINEKVEDEIEDDKPQRKALGSRKPLNAKKTKKAAKEKEENEITEEVIGIIPKENEIQQPKEIINEDKKEEKQILEEEKKGDECVIEVNVNENGNSKLEEETPKRKVIGGKKQLNAKKSKKRSVEKDISIGTIEKQDNEIFKEQINKIEVRNETKETFTAESDIKENDTQPRKTLGKKKINKKKEGKKKSKKTKKENEVEQFEVSGKNKFIEYSSGDDCNRDGLRRAKKKPIGLNYYSEKKGLLTDEDLMEDEHYCGMSFKGDETKSVFGVFDGYGGIAAARETRRILPDVLHNLIEKGLDSKELLEKGFEEVDEGLNKEKYMDIGCTCTILYIWKEDNDLYVRSGNVGDSTCFVKKMNGGTPEIITLSQDHKVTSACEQKRMRDAGIQLVEGQKRINGVGVARTLANHFVKNLNVGMIGTPYISPVVELESGDEIIVCSDGIWDVMSPEKAFEILESSGVVEAPKEIMLQSTKIPECRDNVTVIVVKVL